MIERSLSGKILRDLSWSPIVGLVGSRQVGKTTLVKHLQSSIPKPTLYLDLELRRDWFKLEDAQTYLADHAEKCVIIDEIQVRPELFALLRALDRPKKRTCALPVAWFGFAAYRQTQYRDAGRPYCLPRVAAILFFGNPKSVFPRKSTGCEAVSHGSLLAPEDFYQPKMA